GGSLPRVSRRWLRRRSDRRWAPGGRVHYAFRNHGDRRAHLGLVSGRSQRHVRNSARRIRALARRPDRHLGIAWPFAPPQSRTWNRLGPVMGPKKSTNPLDAVTPSKRPGCSFEIRQLIVRVPALPSSYSTRRMASPAVLPGMLGTEASARSHSTSPVTL